MRAYTSSFSVPFSAVAALVLLWSDQARALTFTKQFVEQCISADHVADQFNQAPYVFAVRVFGESDPSPGFIIEHVWKGDLKRVVITYKQLPSTVITGGPLRNGDLYLVFAKRSSDPASNSDVPHFEDATCRWPMKISSVLPSEPSQQDLILGRLADLKRRAP